jgi:hypothetical protein
MTEPEAKAMRAELMHDLGEAVRQARQQAHAAPATRQGVTHPSVTQQHTRRLGEMLHHDDTTQWGW